MTISVEQYLMGRDKKYQAECTPAIRANAVETVRRVNLLLIEAALDGARPGVDQVTGCAVSSGWRPPAVNDRTSNAAATSKHLTGEACDIQDAPGRPLAHWCARNPAVLERIQLWCEDFRFTGGADPWCHFQTRPPNSGARIYVPSTAPPNDPTFKG